MKETKSVGLVTSTLNRLQEEVKSKGIEVVTQAFNDLFSKFPEVEAFRFIQYRPFFMDGDVCHFNVHELKVLLKSNPVTAPVCTSCEEPLTEGTKYCGECGTKVPAKHEPEFQDCYELKDKNLSSQMSELKHDLLSANTLMMETLFGDHAQVTVTRDTITTERYDHD